MTPKDYMKTQMALIQVGKLLKSVDLEGFIGQLSRAQTVAPIMDPTLFQQAAANLSTIKRMAEACMTVKLKYDDVEKSVLATIKAHGTPNILEMPKPQECPSCGGDGESPIKEGEPCMVCQGSGLVRVNVQPVPKPKPIGLNGDINGPGSDPDTV